MPKRGEKRAEGEGRRAGGERPGTKGWGQGARVEGPGSRVWGQGDGVYGPRATEGGRRAEGEATGHF